MTYEQHLEAARERLGVVRCVSFPVGPHVVVKVPGGPLIYGYRVPWDYVPSGVHEVVFEGQSVEADWEHVPDAEVDRLVIKPVEPPELP